MRLFIFLFLVLTILSCKTKSVSLKSLDEVKKFAFQEEDLKPYRTLRCNQPEFFIPDTNYPNLHPMRKLKVVFHIMNSSTRKYNYEGQQAIDYFSRMLEDANGRLGRNEKLNLPEGNDYPVYDPGYRYSLYKDPLNPEDNGFHFHYDDELYYFINKGANRNNFKREVIREYAIKPDSLINIFIMPHHPDSIASPTYPGYGSGIALGTSLKMAGIFESGAGPHAFSSILNHEVGHILGLTHSWLKNDGCLDTPQHPNCYGPSKDPPCDGAISNNMMDYNFAQIALSPCQIGKIHKNFARLRSKQRKLIDPTWCEYKEELSVSITDSVAWKGGRDLEGDLIIEKGAVLSIHCRVSMPPDSKIIVKPGGSLILDGAELHNACQLDWNGIEVQQKKELSGKIIIRNDIEIRDLARNDEQVKS